MIVGSSCSRCRSGAPAEAAADDYAEAGDYVDNDDYVDVDANEHVPKRRESF